MEQVMERRGMRRRWSPWFVASAVCVVIGAYLLFVASPAPHPYLQILVAVPLILFAGVLAGIGVLRLHVARRRALVRAAGALLVLLCAAPLVWWMGILTGRW